MENKILLASEIIDWTIEDENYKNAKLVVIEDFIVRVSEELKDILHSTYKSLRKYEVIRWTTDWHVNGNEDIKTLVIFVKTILAHAKRSGKYSPTTYFRYLRFTLKVWLDIQDFL